MLCGKIVNNIFHPRGPCEDAQQEGLITDAANHQVQAIAKEVRSGELGKHTLLVNAGTKFAPSKKEDHTVPLWMLPAHIWGALGQRRFKGTDVPFADKPDMMQIIGWTVGTPTPTNDAATKKRLTLRIGEHRSAQDLYTEEARREKCTRYALLVAALRTEGWRVDLHNEGEDPREHVAGLLSMPLTVRTAVQRHCAKPIYTIVIGHTGYHTPQTRQALLALGVQEHDALLHTLSRQAVSSLHTCLSSYCAAVKRRGAVGCVRRRGGGRVASRAPAWG